MRVLISFDKVAFGGSGKADFTATTPPFSCKGQHSVYTLLMHAK